MKLWRCQKKDTMKSTPKKNGLVEKVEEKTEETQTLETTKPEAESVEAPEHPETPEKTETPEEAPNEFTRSTLEKDEGRRTEKESRRNGS